MGTIGQVAKVAAEEIMQGQAQEDAGRSVMSSMYLSGLSQGASLMAALSAANPELKVGELAKIARHCVEAAASELAEEVTVGKLNPERN